MLDKKITLVLGPVVQIPISTNPVLTLNKTYRVNPGLALIGLRTTGPSLLGHSTNVWEYPKQNQTFDAINFTIGLRLRSLVLPSTKSKFVTLILRIHCYNCRIKTRANVKLFVCFKKT